MKQYRTLEGSIDKKIKKIRKMARGSLAIWGCLLVAVIGSVHADAPEALVGAEFAKEGEFPYLVSIRTNNQLHCGGAIIGPQHILTAAHCLLPLLQRPLSDVTIVTGTNNLHSGGLAYRPATYVPHPLYPKYSTWKYDIGVIKLATPIQFTGKEKVIPLPTSNSPVHVGASIGAWGATSSPPRDVSPMLKKLKLNILSKQECQYYFPQENIEDIQICTFNKKNVGTCSGDSGSPLAHNGVVIGVVSGGIPCATGLPDIFTNVFEFLPFIKNAMSV